MDSGICYIKTEFQLPAEPKKIEETPTSKRPAENTNSSENVPAEKTQKLEDGKKSKKNRGQNKNRPVFREDKEVQLCQALANGPNNTCTYPNCKYLHDVPKFMSEKPKDIGESCYNFQTKGFCFRGLTCRFASSHIDENFNNKKLESYDPNTPDQICNGITSKLQIQLRKREYDFTESLNFAKLYEQQQKDDKSKSKETSTETLEETSTEEVPKESTEDSSENKESEKPLGSVADAEEKPKKVDFRNKLMLSPLTTVGNLPFRRICKEFGADITCGEMACSVPLVKGLNQEWALTKRHISEDIFGVQICGNKAHLLGQVSQLLKETAKVDFVDLNIGCPIELIYQQGGGSALMRRPACLEMITRTCSSVLGDIPFTVKMRTGVYADKSVAHELFPKVEEWGASAVTIHGRSREQRYTKNANWEYIEECASKVNRIPVIGNGDILSWEEYNEKKKIAPHVSSVMLGRGALIKPWIFKEIKEGKTWDPTSSERFEILQKFTNYGLEHWGSDTKGVECTRRFLLEWQSFLYRYVPYGIMESPPQRINQRPQFYRGRDEMETLMSSHKSSDWIKLSEMLLGSVPEGFTFLPKHKANAF